MKAIKRFAVGTLLALASSGAVAQGIWQGLNLTNPGPIGCGGTPAAGCFTTLDTSSIVTLPLGSAAATTIRPTGGAAGDGIFWVTATNLAFATSGSEKFRFGSSGQLANTLGYASGASTGSPDVFWVREAAGVWASRNAANAQTIRVYNTFTDASNYERGIVGWVSSDLVVGVENAGTGAANRQLHLKGGASGQIRLVMGASNIMFANTTGLMAGTDNTYDIGASGATRPRSIYTATDVSAPKFRARGGTTPTMGACGTSPSVAGNDSGMLITVGTGGAATSCAVTFASTWTTAPVCVAQNNTDRVAYSMATTATTLTITAAAAFTASSLFHVICMGVA